MSRYSTRNLHNTYTFLLFCISFALEYYKYFILMLHIENNEFLRSGGRGALSMFHPAVVSDAHDFEFGCTVSM